MGRHHLSRTWMTNLGLTTVVSLAVVVTVAAPAVAQPATGEIIRSQAAAVVPDSYVVVFKDTVQKGRSGQKAKALSARFGGRVGTVLDGNGLRGFEVLASEIEAKRIAADADVDFVQENGIHQVDAADTQSPTPSWGLDRIDQRLPPMNEGFTFPTRASSVVAYVIDTGIRLTHTEFGGRAVTGVDVIDGGSANDLHGHGTHVAGTIGGVNVGVAKNVRLVAVRVLNEGGSGTDAQIASGVNWVTDNRPPSQRAVANMSIGKAPSATIDQAVRLSIASGVTYVVSAGNSGANACGQSPARVTEAITVGSTTRFDVRASTSNIGSCVDIFAPGDAIVSASWANNTALRTESGTSMAAPHVAGAAAIALARLPFLTPAQVRDYLVGNSTKNIIVNVGSGSPNALLYVEQLMPAAVGVSAPNLATPVLFQGGPGVAVSWTDTAFNEDGFQLWRANGGGLVVDFATVDKRGSGITYTHVDSRAVQGTPQCYFAVAYDNPGSEVGVSEVLCVGD